MKVWDRMKKYQNTFLYSRVRCSGIFKYLKNVGGLRKPRGVQRGLAKSSLYLASKTIFEEFLHVVQGGSNCGSVLSMGSQDELVRGKSEGIVGVDLCQ